MMIDDLGTLYFAGIGAIGAAVIVYLVAFNLILSRSSSTKGPRQAKGHLEVSDTPEA